MPWEILEAFQNPLNLQQKKLGRQDGRKKAIARKKVFA